VFPPPSRSKPPPELIGFGVGLNSELGPGWVSAGGGNDPRGRRGWVRVAFGVRVAVVKGEGWVALAGQGICQPVAKQRPFFYI